MKQMCISMRCLAFLAFFAICSFGFAQMPTGYPVMPNTGNPSVDAETYEQAKGVWLQNNPQYQQTTPVEVVAPGNTAQDNEAYELQKGLNYTGMPVSNEEKAAQQLRQLRVDYDQHYAEWNVNQGRLVQAYVEVFTMARGQSVVTVTATQYASFFPELKALVDANSNLFNVAQ